MQQFIQEFLTVKANAVQYIHPEEVSAVLDLDGYVLYPTPCMSQLFSVDLVGTLFLEIKELAEYKCYLNETLIKVLGGHYIQRSIIFLHGLAYLFEFKGIVNPANGLLQLIVITLSPYIESNLLLCKLKENKYTKSNMNLEKEESLAVIQGLTKFQLAICYLLARNYTNSEIADIINLSKNRSRPTSRFAINKQVEKIRSTFSMPSKDALVDLIIQLNIHCSLPQLLYKNPIELIT